MDNKNSRNMENNVVNIFIIKGEAITRVTPEKTVIKLTIFLYECLK